MGGLFVLTNNSLSLSESGVAASALEEFVVLVCCGVAPKPLAPAP